MPRAEKGTPKYLANKMKAKGLQKLRWYCQVCQKQCRDENGFKCHSESESHIRMMLLVGEKGGSYINSYSQEFRQKFLNLLSRRYGTQRIFANQVYQEYIQDKDHLHMNSTRWVSLTQFCNSLAKEGTVKLDETERGLFIQWIDNSPKAIAKNEAIQKKERKNLDDEQREQKLIKEQVERVRNQETKNPIQKNKTIQDEINKNKNGESNKRENIGLLQRNDEKQPIKLNFFNQNKDNNLSVQSIPTSESGTEGEPELKLSGFGFGSGSGSGSKFSLLKSKSSSSLSKPTNVFSSAKRKDPAKDDKKSLTSHLDNKQFNEMSEIEKGLQILDETNKRRRLRL